MQSQDSLPPIYSRTQLMCLLCASQVAQAALHWVGSNRWLWVDRPLEAGGKRIARCGTYVAPAPYHAKSQRYEHDREREGGGDPTRVETGGRDCDRNSEVNTHGQEGAPWVRRARAGAASSLTQLGKQLQDCNRLLELTYGGKYNSVSQADIRHPPPMCPRRYGKPTCGVCAGVIQNRCDRNGLVCAQRQDSPPLLAYLSNGYFLSAADCRLLGIPGYAVTARAWIPSQRVTAPCPSDVASAWRRAITRATPPAAPCRSA